MTPLGALNSFNEDEFVRIAGPWFEKSPWVARRTYANRPFASRDDLHVKLVETVTGAPDDDQVKLINAHPDLVGKASVAGELTAESTREQAAAGLGNLSAEDREQFRTYNAQYRERFGFPFIICARENKKDAILAAFPVRLKNTREQEIATALSEIAKIARLRMLDAVID